MKKMMIAAGFVLAGSTAMAFAAVDGGHAAAAQDAATMMPHGAHHAMSDQSMGSMANLSASRTLAVTDCWIRLLPEPAPSAGYFVIKNTGDQPVTLTGAASAAFGMVMLHQTTEKDGMSKMSMASEIPIPAGAELAFKPGSYHAMLEKPAMKLTVGSFVNMDFQFSGGEKATASCEIKAANTRVR